MDTMKDRVLLVLEVVAQDYADLDITPEDRQLAVASYMAGMMEAFRILTGLPLEDAAHADALAAMVDADLTEACR